MWRNAGREAIQYDPKMLQKGQYGQASWSVSELSYESKNIMNYTDRVFFLIDLSSIFKKEISIEQKPQRENFKVHMERVIQPCWRSVVPALLVANQTLVLGVGELQMHS